jgi:hypothetical protein
MDTTTTVAKAQEIIDLVAAGTTIVAHRRVPAVSLGDIETVGCPPGRDHRVVLHVAGETATRVKELLGWVRDAARAVGAEFVVVKRGSYSIQGRAFENDPFGQIADYHATVRIYGPKQV